MPQLSAEETATSLENSSLSEFVCAHFVIHQLGLWGEAGKLMKRGSGNYFFHTNKEIWRNKEEKVEPLKARLSLLRNSSPLSTRLTLTYAFFDPYGTPVEWKQWGQREGTIDITALKCPITQIGLVAATDNCHCRIYFVTTLDSVLQVRAFQNVGIFTSENETAGSSKILRVFTRLRRYNRV